MSQTFVIQDDNGTEREFDSRAEAEEAKADLEALGAEVDLTVRGSEGDSSNTESQSTPTPDVVEETQETDTQPVEEVPEEPPQIDQDPVDWMPEHFVDTIQGVPTVNRKGYAVIAAQYDVSVTAEPVTLASETDFEYAEFRAAATTDDGKEYSGFGSAHVDRMDGDDKHLLNELAETRALKRATAWATGVGMTAISEMQGEL